MKKAILVLAVLFTTTLVHAQFSFGPKIGYNTSKLSVEKTDIKTDLKNSFQFGVFLRIGKKYYVQPELAFLTQGGIFKTPSISGGLSPFKQEVNLKTVQVPLMIGVKAVDLKVANIRIMAGPVASFVTKKTIENKVADYAEPIKQADLKDAIWSAQIGIGADVLMFTLDIRYNLGLSKIIDKVKIGEEDVVFDSKTSGFNITLGWKIM